MSGDDREATLMFRCFKVAAAAAAMVAAVALTVFAVAATSAYDVSVTSPAGYSLQGR